MRFLNIKFDTGFALRFKLESHEITRLWTERFKQRYSWPLDDPSRFYGLQDPAVEKTRAFRDLTKCIQVINNYQPIIDRRIDDLEDQDTLNYLHNIFEKYHGLLDKQDSKWWKCAPRNVQQALADLNIAVHRMESVKDNRPRIVCTWFGMPKDHLLDSELMRRHGSLNTEWGGVYLNYVEIGKTLEDLANDKDRWIGEDAFQPFRHYSADFNVKFHDRPAPVDAVRQYWEEHKDFFSSRGIHTWDDPSAFPYRFKIAQLAHDLDRETVLQNLSNAKQIMDTYLE